jgi:hypothetical protein
MEGKRTMTQLIVERVDHISSRPWLFVTGRLTGDPLYVGDEMVVTLGQSVTASAVIRAIEFHTRQGMTTIAVDDDLDGSIQAGAVLTRD